MNSPDAGSLRIVGIDPGTRVMGFGVIDVDSRDRVTYVDCGTLAPKKTATIAERLLFIHEGLALVMEKFQPGAVAVEQVFVGKSTPSAIRIGEARGLALVCGARVGAEIFEYPPATVKRAIAGFGAAEKTQMAEWIARLLGLREAPQPHDAADALAIALTHAYRRRVFNVSSGGFEAGRFASK